MLAVFWMLFGVLHSCLASIRVKEKSKQILGRQFKNYRVYYTIFAFVTMIAVLIYQFSIPSFYLFKTTTTSNILGIAVAASGLVIMILCIKKYFFSLSGLRSLITEHKGNDLIITGIHRYVRHPLYLGTFLFIWGAWILFPYLSLFIADVIITAYTLIGISFEEAKLETEFGEQYKQYKASVPKLIPFI
jgi:protein-S-isoprenylcysteine O-methyltransferase Ste14